MRNINILKKLADGSAQGNMSSSQIEDALEISFPENLDEQKRIAEILSAFDDKIE
jgi:restriction endonuclease S subunit